MVAYNFQNRFAPDIRSGAKKNTIRAMRKGRSRHARPGEALQLYTGMRTSVCEKLIDDPTCLNVLPIEINQNCCKVFIRLDGRELRSDEAEELAIADGFKNVEELAAFFKETHGLHFEGVSISWD